MHNNRNQESQIGRRHFLQTTSELLLSGTAIALIGGCATTNGKESDSLLEQDIGILNTAIAAEHEAVAAYQLGAESGLLSAGVLNVAVTFQGHHKQHIAVLASTVSKFSDSEYFSARS